MPVKVTDTGVQIVFYRSSTAKPKDLFTLYIHHLIVQVWQQQHCQNKNYSENLLSQVNNTRGFYFNTKSQKVEQYAINHEAIDTATAELSQFLRVYSQGQKQALMLNGELAAQVFKESRGKRVEMNEERFEQFWYGAAMQIGGLPGFGQDLYINYFWQQCPVVDSVISDIESVYTGLYTRVIKDNKSTSSTKGTRR